MIGEPVPHHNALSITVVSDMLYPPEFFKFRGLAQSFPIHLSTCPCQQLLLDCVNSHVIALQMHDCITTPVQCFYNTCYGRHFTHLQTLCLSIPLGAKIRELAKNYCSRYMSKKFTRWMNQSLTLFFEISSLWSKLEIGNSKFLCNRAHSFYICSFGWTETTIEKSMLKESWIGNNYLYLS